MKFLSLKKNNGFTLIEIMVATSIFMVVMLVAMGSLVVSSGSAKKARALRTTMDNISFAMESMTRTLRTATEYSCITSDSFSLPIASNADCALSGGNGMAFTRAENYLLCHNDPNDSNIEDPDQCRTSAYALVPRSGGDGFTIKRYGMGSDDSGGVSLVADNVNIEDLRFYVSGSTLGDPNQPKAYIIMRGSVLVNGEITKFALQTMASQRVAK